MCTTEKEQDGDFKNHKNQFNTKTQGSYFKNNFPSPPPKKSPIEIPTGIKQPQY